MTSLPPRHPAWIEVDLEALASNARVLREALPAGAGLGILVKANGYGHGTVAAATGALAGGADRLVVAAFEEGVALRDAGIAAPVIVAYPIASACVAEAAGLGLELSVSGLSSARELAAAWRAGDLSRGGGLRVHVEVDTGMGRGGSLPEDVVATFEALETARGIVVAGLWSHLSDGSSPETTARQVAAFERSTGLLAASGRVVPLRHMTATEGLVAGTGPAYDFVRIGLAFYGELGVGVTPSPALAPLAARLRPAMTIRARAVHLEPVPAGAPIGYGSEWVAPRPSVVATLPIGYADGWTRAYSPGAEVLVRGRRVPVIGRISMDSTVVDVTAVPGVTLDDEFVLLGAQGDDRVTADELARLRRTVTNEVIAALGPRIPRVVVGGD